MEPGLLGDSSVSVFPIADFRLRIYWQVLSVPLMLALFILLALTVDLPFRAATIIAAFALAMNLLDLALRSRSRVEVSGEGIRFLGLGLRPSVRIPAEDIIEVAALRAPFLPGSVPLLTANYFMAIAVGRCLAVRTKQTAVKWRRWHAFRVTDPGGLVDAVRRYMPHVAIDTSLNTDPSLRSV